MLRFRTMNEQELRESLWDAVETLLASSMASSDRTEGTTPYQPRNTNENSIGDTVNSGPQGQSSQPFDVEAEPVEEDDEDGLLSETIAGLLDEVWAEVLRAIEKHPTPHASPHESYAIIKEELDELWGEIMTDRGRQASARKEAVQIAAMAVRFLLDVDPS